MLSEFAWLRGRRKFVSHHACHSHSPRGSFLLRQFLLFLWFPPQAFDTLRHTRSTQIDLQQSNTRQYREDGEDELGHRLLRTGHIVLDHSN